MVRNVMGANDRISIGPDWGRRYGPGRPEGYVALRPGDCVAVADPYVPNRDTAIMMTNGAAKGYNDFREVLDRKDIDAVMSPRPTTGTSFP